MSDLLHGFSRQNRQAEALRRKMEDAEAWMQVRCSRLMLHPAVLCHSTPATHNAAGGLSRLHHAL